METQDNTTQPMDNFKEIQSAKMYATMVYSLQAISFFVGVTLIIAVIINYVKKEDVRDTWVSSHFRWQIRTFWFCLLWALIGMATYIFVIGYFILVANIIWLIYRIIKGWLRLSEEKEMYV